MTKKTVLTLASVALAAVALAPLGLAHYDLTSHPIFETGGRTEDRVAGIYYADMSLLADHMGLLHIGPIDHDQNTTVELSPPSTIHNLCDLEVLSPGDGTANAIDEPEIDGVDNPDSALSLTLFNDGGVGAVCHTHEGYYANSDWNTPGCDYDPAFGVDVSDVRVWLTTICDYAHFSSGIELFTYAPACAANAVRVDNINGLVGCATGLLGCIASGPVECPLAPGFYCGPGPDGFGGVQSSVGGWSNDGVAFPPIPPTVDDFGDTCDNDDATAIVVAWTAVFVETAGPFPVIEVSTPTVGVIY